MYQVNVSLIHTDLLYAQVGWINSLKFTADGYYLVAGVGKVRDNFFQQFLAKSLYVF